MKKIRTSIELFCGTVISSIIGVLSSKPIFAQSADTGSPELNDLLNTAINVLTAIAVFAFVIAFIIAGYQYMTARDNASQVTAAKERMTSTVIAVVVYFFGYAILQWLVPGGIFN